MVRNYGPVVVLLLALAALPAAAPMPSGAAGRPAAQAAQGATLDPEFMGMAIRDPWYEFNTNPAFPDAPNQAFQDTMGETLEQARVRWVRLEFHIPYNPAVADPCNADCQWEIAKNDYFINTVAPRHNLKVLALLSFGMLRGNDPCLLNKNPNQTSPRFGGGVNPAIASWLTRALAIADRYQERIGAYEVLNEENRLPQCGTPSVVNGVSLNAIAPTITGRLITKLYRFCHNLAPLPPDEPTHACGGSQIILGGIHPRGSSAPGKSATALSDAAYLTAIYTDTASFAGFQSDPNHQYYPLDGIAYHPYPEEIRLSPQDQMVDRGLSRMRLALASIHPPSGRGDACKQFWITELGYNVDFDPDGPKNPRPPQTEAGQAAFMQDVYTSLAQRQLDQRACGGGREIANIFWFKYEDFPPAEIIYDDKGNPKQYPQKWGIVRIPILSDGGCEGGCYDPSGVPSLYRQSFSVYRSLSDPGSEPGNRNYLPTIPF